MDLDDLAPPPKRAKGHELGKDLTKLSVGELEALIGELKEEVARVEQALVAKRSSKSAADAAFKR
jgi:uncharacterized small protein (DUF1192 family)